MNHGFIDGNNRVAFASVILFLQANQVLPEGEEDWIKFIYSNIEAATLRKNVLDKWLREHTSPMPSDDHKS